MPIYEYICQKCHNKSAVLVRSISEPFTPVCPNCDSQDMTRTLTSFSYHKSMSTVWEESGEPRKSSSPDYYKDPRNIGRWTEKQFKDYGLDVPPQIKEKIDAARDGELPESIKG